ncbi:MAG: class I SAM-dependent methyltransferase [Chloroflexota bacterium]|nr:class I SAM-dependent methyltransferase [Chloroflexota bacterium]
MARDVTPLTPLEELHLDWRERDLPEGERTKHVHRLHPYLGKFVPQLVETFLRKYWSPGQTVLDPFCGSGTTLVQANELGVHAVGYDISAFNVLLCRAKTARYDPVLVRREALDLLEQTQATVERDADGTDNAYLRAWYAPAALRQLLTYRRLLDASDYTYRDLLRVILSRSARSARMAPHYALDFPKTPQPTPYWCYKHSRECFPTSEALKFLRRYTADTLERIAQFDALRGDATVAVHHANALHAPLAAVDGVITSPPYVGLIDYHEQHAYAYQLLGLADRRREEIGPAAGGSSQVAKQRYQAEIARVFRRLANVMPRGSRMIVVANDRAMLYDEIADLAGVDVEGVVTRHVDRRTGMRGGTFSESVFVWRTR